MPGRANSPSSTSSSSRRLLRDIVTTVLAVGALVLIAECAFRSALPHLSRNSRSLDRAPERAARIREISDRTRVLILGNSIGREGIDVDLLGDLLARHGQDVHIERQAADSSDMREWTYQLQNQFLAAGAVPDVLILPVGNLQPLLREKPPSEDLLYSFLRFGDLPELFREAGISSPAAKAHIVLRKTLALYGFRGRLQKRALFELFSGYPDLRRLLRALRPEPAGGGAPRTTTTWIERMGALAEEAGTRVVVVVMPTADLEGELPPPDRRAAARLGWTVLEPAPDGAFGEEDRPDGLHLTESARLRFTEVLAEPLAAVLAEDPPPTRQRRPPITRAASRRGPRPGSSRSPSGPGDSR